MFLLTKRRKIIDKELGLKIDPFFNMSLLFLHCLVLWFSQQIKLDGERRNREYETEIRRDKLVTWLIEEEQKRP